MEVCTRVPVGACGYIWSVKKDPPGFTYLIASRMPDMQASGRQVRSYAPAPFRALLAFLPSSISASPLTQLTHLVVVHVPPTYSTHLPT